jgi:MYXO-CTERM domain-containing protein
MALTSVGGIKVTPTGLLNNAAVASAGGFTYHINFLWDGTDSTSFGHAQKLIDYAGTESLQLVTTAGSAALQGNFSDDAGASTTAVSTAILPNTWYDATLEFGNTSSVGGDVAGTANLYLNGSLVASGAATKGTYGDSLNRPIGIGEFGYGHTTSIIGLHGDIYDASVQLGVVPEPSALALGALGGLALRRVRRKKC